jgi:hypothetical protein
MKKIIKSFDRKKENANDRAKPQYNKLEGHKKFREGIYKIERFKERVRGRVEMGSLKDRK